MSSICTILSIDLPFRRYDVSMSFRYRSSSVYSSRWMSYRHDNYLRSWFWKWSSLFRRFARQALLATRIAWDTRILTGHRSRRSLLFVPRLMIVQRDMERDVSVARILRHNCTRLDDTVTHQSRSCFKHSLHDSFLLYSSCLKNALK